MMREIARCVLAGALVVTVLAASSCASKKDAAEEEEIAGEPAAAEGGAASAAEEAPPSVSEAAPGTSGATAEASAGAGASVPGGGAPGVLSTQGTRVSFTDIKNKTWKLLSLRIGAGQLVLDRALMAAEGMGDVFTIQLTAEGVNGKAAPNRYFAPWELQDGRSLRLRTIVGTLMAATVNLGSLMESEYYYYLQRINRWDYDAGASQLRLYAAISSTEEAVLCFVE